MRVFDMTLFGKAWAQTSQSLQPLKVDGNAPPFPVAETHRLGPVPAAKLRGKFTPFGGLAPLLRFIERALCRRRQLGSLYGIGHVQVLRQLDSNIGTLPDFASELPR